VSPSIARERGHQIELAEVGVVCAAPLEVFARHLIA
jgi:hypothetical protein